MSHIASSTRRPTRPAPAVSEAWPIIPDVTKVICETFMRRAGRAESHSSRWAGLDEGELGEAGRYEAGSLRRGRSGGALR